MAIDWKAVGKDYVIPSIVAGSIMGAGIHAVTKKKDEKGGWLKSILAGIGIDTATGLAMGLWKQRNNLTKVADVWNTLDPNGYVMPYPREFWDIIKHKYDVYRAARELDLPVTQALSHDNTKFDPKVFPAYAQFFFGPKKDDKQVRSNFFRAVHVHRQMEPHHWLDEPQYWGPASNMSMPHKLEHLADTWAAFKRKSTDPNFPDFKTWYIMNKDKFAPPDVQEIVRTKIASSLSDLIRKSEEQSKVIKQLIGADRYTKEMQLIEKSLRKKPFITGGAAKLKDLSQ